MKEPFPMFDPMEVARTRAELRWAYMEEMKLGPYKPSVYGRNKMELYDNLVSETILYDY